jgi:hypothetical protein
VDYEKVEEPSMNLDVYNSNEKKRNGFSLRKHHNVTHDDPENVQCDKLKNDLVHICSSQLTSICA